MGCYGAELRRWGFVRFTVNRKGLMSPWLNTADCWWYDASIVWIQCLEEWPSASCWLSLYFEVSAGCRRHSCRNKGLMSRQPPHQLPVCHILWFTPGQLTFIHPPLSSSCTQQSKSVNRLHLHCSIHIRRHHAKFILDSKICSLFCFF